MNKLESALQKMFYDRVISDIIALAYYNQVLPKLPYHIKPVSLKETVNSWFTGEYIK